MTDIIAVANQAGGAGKTTTALGLSGAFADRGDATLLVDLDPQGVATEGTGFKNRDGDKGDRYHQKVLSLHQVLTEPARTDEITTLVEEHPEFDVIPANMAMKGLKDKLGQVANAEMRIAFCSSCLPLPCVFIKVHEAPLPLGSITTTHTKVVAC